MSHSRTARYAAAIVLWAGTLTGCSLGPKMTEQAASYDLGPGRTAPTVGPGIGAVWLCEVIARAWLRHVSSIA